MPDTATSPICNGEAADRYNHTTTPLHSMTNSATELTAGLKTFNTLSAELEEGWRPLAIKPNM